MSPSGWHASCALASGDSDSLLVGTAAVSVQPSAHTRRLSRKTSQGFIRATVPGRPQFQLRHPQAAIALCLRSTGPQFNRIANTCIPLMMITPLVA
jgi:hypothetical protein